MSSISSALMGALLPALLLVSASVFAQQRPPQEWKASSARQAVYAAVLYTPDYARIVVECRTPAALAPEIMISIVPSGSRGSMDTAAVAVFKAEDATVEVPMTRVGDGSAEGFFRWTGSGPAGMAVARKVAEALGSYSPHSVALAGKPTLITQSSIPNSSAVQDVVVRCLPSTVRARLQAAEMSNIQTIMVLERDANGKCRGGGVEDLWGPCGEREEYGERLYELGMCYGRRGEAGYQQSWHRCGPTSTRRG